MIHHQSVKKSGELRKKFDEYLSKRNIAALALIILASTAFSLTFLTDNSRLESQETSFNRADVMFMNMMIIHHDQAIKMAELAPKRTDNENILQLSSNISEAQTAENKQMAEWLGELGYQRPRDGHRMAGMASEEQMQELQKSEGREFDELFSELMITHHRGGIQMAQSFSQRGRNSELIEMEKQMIETQQKEIELMQKWRQNWTRNG